MEILIENFEFLGASRTFGEAPRNSIWVAITRIFDFRPEKARIMEKGG